MQLTAKVYDRMFAHALRKDPEEACGLILQCDGGERMHYVPIRNVAKDPLHNYEMRDETILRVLGMPHFTEMIGIFHSHPTRPPVPSEEDLRLAAYPDVVYWIIGQEDREKYLPSKGSKKPWRISGFRIRDGAVDPVYAGLPEIGSEVTAECGME